MYTFTHLNITYAGKSQFYPVQLESDVTDADVKKVAEEIMATQAGVLFPENGFDDFVVDRFGAVTGVPLGMAVLYVRPKVPFGA